MNKSLKHIIYCFLTIALCFSVTYDVSAQKHKTRAQLNYEKQADGVIALSARVFVRKGPVFFPITNSPVAFSMISDTVTQNLGKSITDENGYATFYIDGEYPFLTDQYGYINFSMSFEGNDSCRAADKDLSVKPVTVSLEFNEEEDYKSISINVKENDSIYAKEEMVYVYVKRLYSLLPIGDDMTDEEGNLEIEFPADIPGDSIGNLEVIVRLEESDNYGTVNQTGNIKWGTPVDFSVKDSDRSLWSNLAPLWMLLAVAVILAAAWSQFFIAIYHLRKMKKSS